MKKTTNFTKAGPIGMVLSETSTICQLSIHKEVVQLLHSGGIVGSTIRCKIYFSFGVWGGN